MIFQVCWEEDLKVRKIRRMICKTVPSWVQYWTSQRHRRGLKAARHRAAEQNTRHVGHHRP
jgi:hypothetical protein